MEENNDEIIDPIGSFDEDLENSSPSDTNNEVQLDVAENSSPVDPSEDDLGGLDESEPQNEDSSIDIDSHDDFEPSEDLIKEIGKLM